MISSLLSKSHLDMSNLFGFDILLLSVLHFHRLGLQHTGLWYGISETSTEPSQVQETHSDLTEPPENDQADSVSQVDTAAQTIEEADAATDTGPRGVSRLVNFFYERMTQSTVPLRRDYYTVMFLFDFLTFAVSIFGFWGFSQYETHKQVQQYILSNRVPLAFLMLLMVEFILIVVDRIICVNKSIMHKLVFYVFTVLGLHVWIFVVLPLTTQIPIAKNTPALMWYVFKCIYLFISALQIRSNYPRQILRVCFTRQYNYTSLALYKLYMLVPFLHEIRMTMDWALTKTSLGLNAWIQAQSIYEEAFVIKCYRQQEKRYVQHAGEVLGSLYKFFTGGILIIFIIFVVWFPLLLFTFNIYDPSPPKRATFHFSLTQFEPWIKVTDDDILPFTVEDYSRLDLPGYFIKQYSPGDVSRVTFYTNRTSIWTMNNDGRDNMIDLLNSTSPLSFQVGILLDRSSGINKYSIARCTFGMPVDDLVRSQLAHNLTLNSNFSFSLSNMLPPYIVINNNVCDQPDWMSPGTRLWNDVSVNYRLSPQNEDWWELSVNKSSEIQFLTFSSRISSKSYSVITNYGIIGLYAYVVIVISRFMRTYITGASSRIMFQELPNVDRLLQLCMDISNAREFEEMELEEYLFATLIMIYRSPELLVQFTSY